MEIKTTIKLFISLTIILAFALMGIWVMYGLSDNGRLIRDYGIHSSGISDTEVKGIWCGINDLPDNYHKEEKQEFCGDVKVKMKCIFSNSGDMCVIEQQGVEDGMENEI